MVKHYHPTIRDDKVYSNCRIFHPDGTLMCCVGRKRINWYLKRGLAKSLSENDIQLLFEPKGKGKHDIPYYLEERVNRCVVCGCNQALTKHHIVPHQYRKALPEQYKDRNHFDILCVCSSCHAAYEKIADKLNNELCYGLRQHIKKKENKSRKAASGLWALKNKENIPSEYVEQILANIARYLKVESITLEEALKLDISDNKESQDVEHIGKKALERYLLDNTAEDFIIMWREHFLTNMLPKYMSDEWVSNYKTNFS
jgi:hypothetical protein